MGAHHDGSIRYMMIRPDALMGIFSRLSPDARREALEALGASIRERGGQSAATYVDAEGKSRLLHTIEATASELGWGAWRFEERGAGYALVVKHSPFAHGARFEGPACHAIAGMCEAVGSIVTGGPVAASETHCANAGSDHCRFLIEPGSV